MLHRREEGLNLIRLSHLPARSGAAALAAVQITGNEIIHVVCDTGDRVRYGIDALSSISEKAYDTLGNAIATTRFAPRPSGLTALTEADVANQVIRFA